MIRVSMLHCTPETERPKLRATSADRVVHLLKVDGTKEVLRVDAEPTLDQMQQWVGGMIEFLRVPYEGRLCIMVVNETGLLLELPVNKQASELYAKVWRPTRYPPDATVIMLGPDEPIIVGDVAILTNFELDGE